MQSTNFPVVLKHTRLSSVDGSRRLISPPIGYGSRQKEQEAGKLADKGHLSCHQLFFSHFQPPTRRLENPFKANRETK
jgi:hypothetical protein